MNWKKKVLLLSDASRYFCRELVRGVTRFVEENRSWSLTFYDFAIHGIQDVTNIEGTKADGILSWSPTPEIHEKLQERSIPMIELFNDSDRFSSDIKYDGSKGCELAFDHFYSLGYRNFSFFSHISTPCSKEYKDLFRKNVLRTSSSQTPCTFLPEGIFDGENSPILRKQAESWLRSLPKPVAILCNTDMSAFFLLELCRNAKIFIPEEVAVMGYGNIAPMCEISQPSLSSVMVDMQQIGYLAASIMDKQMSRKSYPTFPMALPSGELAIRKTSGQKVIADPLVARALGFIRENIAIRPSVMDVARYVKTSKTTLSRLFREWTGHSPEEEIIDIALAWSRDLLKNSTMSINQIAELLRYSTTASFVRAFKRQSDTTPAEFRAFHTKLSDKKRESDFFI